MASLSAIIISPDGLAAVRRLVGHLAEQTARWEMELVFVFPESADRLLDEPMVEEFAAVQVITVENMVSTSVARAAGIRAATAPIVVMTEDHSIPEPGWAEALIEAHNGNWAVVGPSVKNGNPDSLLSWANLAIEYNDWLHPVPAGEIAHLPGHNSAYKRDILMQFYDDDLESWFDSESVLHWDMRSRGYRLAADPAAVTRHWNFSKFWPTMELRWYAGRQFAGSCKLRWSRPRSLLYFFGSPLIPFVRLYRIVKQLRVPERSARMLPRLIPVCLFLLGVEAAGAAAGFLLGQGSSNEYIAKIDFHREDNMNARDRAQFVG